MPVEVVSYMLSSLDPKKCLQFQIVLWCAPFLKGMKTACAVNIEEQYCPELEGILADTDIEYRYLSRDKGKRLVFFYRKKEFSGYLGRTDVRRFLERFGYAQREPEEVLDRLSERVCRYIRRGAGFPHEIGVFLDYPIDDVRCFMEQKGKGGVMTGYWKVYHNPGKEQLIFQAYDKARISAVNEFLAGGTIREIACKRVLQEFSRGDEGGSYELR